jgi:hypothetical protein
MNPAKIDRQLTLIDLLILTVWLIATWWAVVGMYYLFGPFGAFIGLLLCIVCAPFFHKLCVLLVFLAVVRHRNRKRDRGEAQPENESGTLDDKTDDE